MHETSLGGSIRDYLTGEETPNTTYEEMRQALAKLMVEERGYPKDRLRPKVGVSFEIDGGNFCRVVDLVVEDESGRPLLAVLFCSGIPGTYTRETLASARLLPDGPVPLALATDTMDAVLLSVPDGKELGTGMDALPRWEDLPALAQGRDTSPLSEDRAQRERRILYAYSEMLSSCCESTCCPLPGR
ncbi:type I restriction enzyme HsdR N-terminal domain-containing protein [Desulfohalovibrio reitneri]|uniref:type I restriction enzyme HsdR N-terminal domain-containing protein n=1 Tax=Desulfohalovibrio reitneri TaxID=1307759 RepID=UPI0004A6D0CE|nr:type I restriction enzyme HsdR N-terminal domain-containing protein [Desulfohalovibrio reitneri]